MPLSKVTGKTKGAGQGGTHAHYAGEFGTSPRHQLGRQEQNSTLAKNPEYRAARAEYFSHVAKTAARRHTDAKLTGHHVEAAQHALVATHAHQMANKHAKAAEQMTPGSEHARAARAAAQEARGHLDSVEGKNPHFDAKTAVKASHEFPQTVARITHGTGANKALHATADAHTASMTARNSPSIESHNAAADAHERAAAASKAAGDHTQAAQHEAHRQDHLRAVLDVNRAAVGKGMAERSSHPQVLHANELTARAGQATTRAELTGAKADHDAAAVAHGAALSAYHAIGDSGMVKEHYASVEHHESKGSGTEAHREAGDKSALAQSISEKIRQGYSRDHATAERMHRSAAEAAASVGAHDVARHHIEAAEKHRQQLESSGEAIASSVHSIRANQVSAIAQASPSPAAHADAARAHRAAAAAIEKISVSKGKDMSDREFNRIQQHKKTAAEHEKAAQEMMAGHHTDEEKAMIRQIEKDRARGAASGTKFASEQALIRARSPVTPSKSDARDMSLRAARMSEAAVNSKGHYAAASAHESARDWNRKVGDLAAADQHEAYRMRHMKAAKR